MSFRNALLLIALSALIFGLCFAEDITIVEKIGGFRNTQACAVHGGVLYLLDYYYLISFDPATGDFLDTLDLGEYARNIAFADDKAVVVGIAEAHLIDISDPTDMVDLDDVNFGGISGWDVDIEGDLAFLAVQSRMAVYRIVGGSLVAAGSYIPSTPFPMVKSVAVKDATLYVGFGDMGIAALDVTAPSMPVLLMSADTPGHTLDLQIAGDRLVCADGAYIGSDTASVRFFDIPSPATLSDVGEWFSPTGSDCRRSFVVGNRIALADGEGGVRAIDFSAPSVPIELAHRATVCNITDVCVSGDTIFAAGTDTLYIMTTDAFPTDTTVIFSPIRITSVAPSLGAITACDPIVEFAISPGSYAIDDGSVEIEALGTTFTVPDAEISITPTAIILDLSDHSFGENDTIRATIAYLADIAGSTAVGLGTSTEFYYDDLEPEFAIAEGGPDDMQHPDSVVIAGTIADRGFAGFVEDSFKIFVNGMSYGTASMYLSYDAPSFSCEPMGIFHDGDSVEVCIHAVDAVSATYCGPNALDSCWFFKISSSGIGESQSKPDGFAITAFPNPFNSAVKITIAAAGVGASNARSGQVGVKIFDISGRLVADLPVTNCGSPQFVPTPQIWTPDKSLGSGIYLVRTVVGEKSLTKRILYVK